MSSSILGDARPRLTGVKREREVVNERVTPSQTVREIVRMPSRKRRKNDLNVIHKFKRTFAPAQFNTDGTNPYLNAYNFSMNDMPGYTELTALYDDYKLTGVMVKIFPFQTQSNSNASLANVQNVPMFYTIDRNDTTAPASVDAILEYNDHKISNTFRGIKLWIPNPKFQDATNAVRGGWVSTQNPSLNWFGYKLAIPPTGVIATFYTTWTFYVSCKNAR